MKLKCTLVVENCKRYQQPVVTHIPLPWELLLYMDGPVFYIPFTIILKTTTTTTTTIHGVYPTASYTKHGRYITTYGFAVTFIHHLIFKHDSYCYYFYCIILIFNFLMFQSLQRKSWMKCTFIRIFFFFKKKTCRNCEMYCCCCGFYTYGCACSTEETLVRSDFAYISGYNGSNLSLARRPQRFCGCELRRKQAAVNTFSGGGEGRP